MPELGCWVEDFLVRKVGISTNLAPAASGIDTAFVRAGLQTSQDPASYWEGDFWTASGDFWFTVTLAKNTAVNHAAASIAPLVTLRDSSTGTDVVRITHTARSPVSSATDIVVEYNNGAGWTVLPGSAVFSQLSGITANVRVALRVKLDASAGVIGWYANGVLMGEATGDTLHTAATTIDTVRFLFGHTGTGNLQFFFSEAYAHTDDLRHARIGVFVPAAPTGGDPVAWTSDYTSINEQVLNEATVISTTTAGDVESWNGANDRATAAAGMTVLAVGMATWGRRGATGPQNLQFGIWLGGTFNYTGNLAGVSAGYGVQHYEWAVRPDTAATFSLADVDAIRWAVKATA